MRLSTYDAAKLGQKFVNESKLWKQTEDDFERTAG